MLGTTLTEQDKLPLPHSSKLGRARVALTSSGTASTTGREVGEKNCPVERVPETLAASESVTEKLTVTAIDPDADRRAPAAPAVPELGLLWVHNLARY